VTGLSDLTPRYRSIIPDWEAFAATCVRPLPPICRVNTLRCEPSHVLERFAAQGIVAEPMPWDEALLRTEVPVGRTLEHWLGLIYVQEATQTIPVLALDPQPGECILDLCAAPGGKTTQIAARMANRGCLVANEPNGRRQPSLLANINRLGVLVATVTSYRGDSFPSSGPYDRILVDAPCSAEGTLRKESSLRGGATSSSIERLAALQRRLIVRAYDLLKPGGTLVYSTCTFAPEENEAVVAHLLGASDARVVRPGLHDSFSPGLTTWNDEEYPEAIQDTVRIYPHQIDSGGGYLACLVRPR